MPTDSLSTPPPAVEPSTGGSHGEASGDGTRSNRPERLRRLEPLRRCLRSDAVLHRWSLLLAGRLEVPVIYAREFILQSSHFNGLTEYEAWDAKDFEVCCRGTHGHNFKVTCEIAHHIRTVESVGWVIDDVALASIFKQYDNCNLSTTAPFGSKYRATVEHMAETFATQVWDAIYSLHGERIHHACRVRVRVQETDAIWAETFKGSW